MELLNYVRRCKNKIGFETHKTLHAANNDYTFCGKELNGMWWIESSAGLSVDDIPCKQCIKILKGENNDGTERISR